jgi:hypothetical protein
VDGACSFSEKTTWKIKDIAAEKYALTLEKRQRWSSHKICRLDLTIGKYTGFWINPGWNKPGKANK